MPDEAGIVDSIGGAILDVWKGRGTAFFENEIKPESELAKTIALSVAQVTYELATAETDEEASQKRATLKSARRTLQRKAEEKGAVIRQEVWEGWMDTIEAVGHGIAIFAKGVIGGIV